MTRTAPDKPKEYRANRTRWLSDYELAILIEALTKYPKPSLSIRALGDLISSIAINRDTIGVGRVLIANGFLTHDPKEEDARVNYYRVPMGLQGASIRLGAAAYVAAARHAVAKRETLRVTKVREAARREARIRPTQERPVRAKPEASTQEDAASASLDGHGEPSQR